VSSNKEHAVCDACQQGKSHQLPFQCLVMLSKLL
jgi:hypothetical protein